MSQETKKVTLQLMEELVLRMPVCYTSKNVHHSSYLLSKYPDGLLIVPIHNKLNTMIQFNQRGPCHLLEFDERGIHTGTGISMTGLAGLYMQMAQGKLLMLSPHRFWRPLRNRPYALMVESLYPTLLNTWLTTTYVVNEPRIEIRIGAPNPELKSLLKEHNATEWAFITATTPGSGIVPQDENEERHLALLKELKQYTCLEGAGIGADDSEPTVRSLLVLGIDVTTAENIGRAFSQGSIVTGSIDTLPELRILSDGATYI